MMLAWGTFINHEGKGSLPNVPITKYIHKPYSVKWSIKGGGGQNAQKTVHVVYECSLEQN